MHFLFNCSDRNSTASPPEGIRVNEGRSHVAALPVGIMKIFPALEVKKGQGLPQLSQIWNHSAAQKLGHPELFIYVSPPPFVFFWHVSLVNICVWIMLCCGKKKGPGKHFSLKEADRSLDLSSSRQAPPTATGRFITSKKGGIFLLFNYTHESTLWIRMQHQDKSPAAMLWF